MVHRRKALVMEEYLTKFLSGTYRRSLPDLINASAMFVQLRKAFRVEGKSICLLSVGYFHLCISFPFTCLQIIKILSNVRMKTWN